MATWLITGCSSGLGRELAEAVLAAGHNAVVTSRDSDGVQSLVQSYPETALGLSLDVRDQLHVRDAVRSAQNVFGHIDVLVNNAGYGYRAAVEEGDEEDVRELFATNLFGAVNLIKAVLPGMRAQRSGTIVNISSIGARRCAPGSGYYSASKAALEALTEALRKEVEPLGITAFTVEPGGMRTDFAGRSLTQSTALIVDYEATAGQRRKETDSVHGTQPGDPRRAAAAIVATVDAPARPSLLLLGSDAVRDFRAVQDRLMDELSAWEHVSESCDFPESAPMVSEA